MDGVLTLVSGLQTDAVALIAGATALILGIPIAFKGIQLGKRVISKV
ncbi:MAG: hypothetical protein M1337_02685 [Actinobacteria bacterium]|nr:hypothetical protein [Actinomycetota bacterium]